MSPFNFSAMKRFYILLIWLFLCKVSDAQNDDYLLHFGPSATSTSCQSPSPTDGDYYGFYKWNCTSFVAWRLNSGNTAAPFLFHNTMFGSNASGCTEAAMQNKRLSDACRWDGVLGANGFAVDNVPAPGAIAHWGAGEAPSPYGHVAYVVSIDTDPNYIWIEDYNWAPCAYRYIKVLKTSVPRFIHFNDLAQHVLELQSGLAGSMTQNLSSIKPFRLEIPVLPLGLAILPWRSMITLESGLAILPSITMLPWPA